MKKRISFLLTWIMVLCVFAVPAAAAQGASSGADAPQILLADRTQSARIDSFTVTELSDGRYQLDWKISRSSSEVLVEAYLSPSDHDHEAEAAALGSIRSGAKGSLAVTIPDVDSGYYHFRLDVTTMGGMMSYAFSEDAIFFDNENGLPKLSGVVAGRSEDTVYAVWDGESAAILYLYDSETKELLLKRESIAKPASAAIPSGHDDIVIGVAAYDGAGGRFTPIPADRKDLPAADDPFGEEEVTNIAEQTITLDESDGEIRVFANNEECRVKNGTCKVDLEEGRNDLLALVTAPSGHTAAFAKTLTLDTVPPILTLENTGLSVMTSKDHVFLQGFAEEDAFVTCDNDAVAMVGDCFSIEKQVGYGTQTIRLAASDKAGNVTTCNIEVTRSFWGEQAPVFILEIVLAAAGAAAELWLLFFRKKDGAKDDGENDGTKSGKKKLRRRRKAAAKEAAPAETEAPVSGTVSSVPAGANFDPETGQPLKPGLTADPAAVRTESGSAGPKPGMNFDPDTGEPLKPKE